jgi:hypothetical protein
VKTFDMPLLKTKDLPARYPLNCESRARFFEDIFAADLRRSSRTCGSLESRESPK